jgi:hypothetical protein
MSPQKTALPPRSSVIMVTGRNPMRKQIKMPAKRVVRLK